MRGKSLGVDEIDGVDEGTVGEIDPDLFLPIEMPFVFGRPSGCDVVVIVAVAAAEGGEANHDCLGMSKMSSSLLKKTKRTAILASVVTKTPFA